ncbi:hypothetical protein BGZ68_003681 [Mortierella alpina]|nr:hypothetical protein BGZ68_003681 [Mortierella alpina]
MGVVVKPEKKVAFSWCGIVDTATLDDLKKNIFDLHPQYAHDAYLEIFVYNGQPKPELIRDNEDLCKILKVAKTTSKARLTISLETPSKNFSAWTFKDVCDEYNLAPGSTDPDLGDLSPFTDIQAAALDSEAHQHALKGKRQSRQAKQQLRQGRPTREVAALVGISIGSAVGIRKDDEENIPPPQVGRSRKITKAARRKIARSLMTGNIKTLTDAP